MRLSPWPRCSLSMVLTPMGLLAVVCALATSYWCVGTHRVVKTLCPSATTELGACTPSNRTLSEGSSDGLVHYVWETGDDRFSFRYFHTGFWLSCEEHSEG
eukprot:g15576.t1